MAPRTQRTTRRKPKAKSRVPLAASAVLPNEIWSEILGYLWKNELKIVRSVGDRHLETLASSLLYRTGYVAARREVLDIFIHLSAHPTIRHFVKEVIYDSSWFDPPEGASQMRDGRYVRITTFYFIPAKLLRLGALFNGLFGLKSQGEKCHLLNSVYSMSKS